MTEFTFSWNIVIYLLGLAAIWGALNARLAELEKKMDKHNNLVERMYRVEDLAARNEGRIKELEHLHPRQDT